MNLLLYAHEQNEVDMLDCSNFLCLGRALSVTPICHNYGKSPKILS